MEREPIRPRDDGHREAQADREFLLLHGIEQARASRRDVDDFTARTISMLLARTPDDALARFARDGEGRNRELRAEYLPIYLDDGTTSDVRELISWLGAYLVHQENPEPLRNDRFTDVPLLHNLLWATEVGEELTVYVPADTDPAIIDALPEKLAGLITAYGYPFQIFLGLNDVDATADNLGDTFNSSYRGTFDSPEAVVHNLIEVEEIMTAVRELSQLYPAAELLRFDEDALWNRVQEVWTVIEDGDQYHVFEN